MKLGVVSSALATVGFQAGLDLTRDIGCSRIEIACAGYHDLAFGDPLTLAEQPEARAHWLDAITSRGLEISALALHGQPLSPDPEAAARYRQQFTAACRLASYIGVERLTLLGGLPEGAPDEHTPVWVVSAFPPHNQQIIEWQWEHRVIPYWTEQGHYASEHGCVLCFEMHPGDVLYNPQALLRLRDQVGEVIACNYDPSHLFWQGIDTIETITRLGPVIRHVHAKDTGLRPGHIRREGILTTNPMSAFSDRPWNFRTVGYGHDELYWRQFISALTEVGYDDVVSIEHEDEYMSVESGLRKAAALLTPLLP